MTRTPVATTDNRPRVLVAASSWQTLRAQQDRPGDPGYRGHDDGHHGGRRPRHPSTATADCLTSHQRHLSCGFLHTDKQYRDSLVYDLLEQPEVQLRLLSRQRSPQIEQARGEQRP